MDAAKRAIDQVFSDTSVPMEVTQERLMELLDHIQVCLDACDEG
jgi:hypothetical protein